MTDLSHFQIPTLNLTFAAQSGSQLLFTLTGLALLLGGWIIYRLGSRLLGISLGAGFGFFVGEVLNVILKVDRNIGLYITIGCSIIGALGALFMIRAITNFMFALIGLLFGALLGRLGSEIYSGMHGMPFTLDQQATTIIACSAGATALVAVFLQRFIMILITSYMGATFLVAGVEYLAMRAWAFPAVLTAGILWQAFAMGRIFRRHPRSPRRDKDRNVQQR